MTHCSMELRPRAHTRAHSMAATITTTLKSIAAPSSRPSWDGSGLGLGLGEGGEVSSIWVRELDGKYLGGVRERRWGKRVGGDT